jgi:preprotein translocase subunit SecF
MPIFLQDLRFAFRQMGKRPDFALTAILSLALDIGATVSAFSIIYAVLMNP